MLQPFTGETVLASVFRPVCENCIDSKWQKTEEEENQY